MVATRRLIFVVATLLLALVLAWLALAPRPASTPPVAAVPGASPVVPAAPAVALPRHADFGSHEVTPDVRHIANWSVHSHDHKNLSFVIVDKKDAKVYVFNPRGQLEAVTPALLGAAVGDHTVPGVGDKPVGQVLPEERTTPAGRFVAEAGLNHHGEDIVWVDYDAAVSMHRVRANIKADRRLERLASTTARDNRISYGCINLPVAFYETVLSPLVRGSGAIIYVLPEIRTAREVFGSYDV